MNTLLSWLQLIIGILSILILLFHRRLPEFMRTLGRTVGHGWDQSFVDGRLRKRLRLEANRERDRQRLQLDNAFPTFALITLLFLTFGLATYILGNLKGR